MKNVIRDRPVLSYYVLTFAISWSLFLLAGGPDFFDAVDWESSDRFLPAVMGLLLGPTIAGLSMTALISGAAGLGDVRSRLGRLRVGTRWYVFALLTPPFIVLAVTMVLWLFSSSFEPPIIEADNKLAAIGPAIGAGFTTLLEEIGWTGFLIPLLRKKRSILETGLFVGVLWGIWHAPQILWVGRTTADEVPMAPYLALYLGFGIASLTAFRVLLVWMYDYTRSIFIVTLMHGVYAASSIQFDLIIPKLTGSDLLVHGWLFSAGLWAAVGVVALLDRRRLLASPGKSDRQDNLARAS